MRYKVKLERITPSFGDNDYALRECDNFENAIDYYNTLISINLYSPRETIIRLYEDGNIIGVWNSETRMEVIKCK